MKLSLFFVSFFLFISTFSQDLPDYFIENVEVDTTQARKEETIRVTYDLSSDIGVSNCPVTLFLSDDLILSTGDVELVTWNSSVGTNSNIVSIPTRVETGTKNILLVANKEFVRRESNYSNNVASSNTTLTIFEELRSDLEVESWTLDNSDVIVGETINSTLIISDSIPPSGDFSIVYLLSEDSIYDTDDYVLVLDNFVFAGNPQNELLTIPIATDPGTWYLLAFLDVEGIKYEADEDNNLAVHEIFVNPALSTNYTITSTNIGTDFERNDFVSFEYVISETENDVNPATTAALYLSRDSVFSTDDRLLGTDPFANPETTDRIDFRIPINIDTGLYELLIVADHELTTKETNEEDNIGVHQIRVIPSPRPDMVFDEILFNGTLSSGQSYTNQAFSYINTTGIGSNEGFEISFFISEDSTLDNSDILLYNDPSEFAPSSSVSQGLIANFTLQTDIDSGEYLLLSYLDFVDEVDEDNEMNNDTIIAITIVNPDLTIGSLSSTETVSGPGLSIPVDVQVDNISQTSGFAAQSKLFFYLSEDDLLDEADTVLKSINIPAIEAGFNSGEINETVIFPSTIDAGDYFLLAVADADSLLSENDETNNADTIPITIQLPDLEVKSPIINPSTITAGRTVTLEFRVDNNADIPAPQSQVKIYLSTDETLEFDEDLFLRSLNIEALDAQGSSTDKILQNVVIPEIEQGDYKVLFAVDADSLISESDETNNITTGDITLTNPDILPINLDLSRDLVGSGESVDFDFVFTNQGDGDINSTSYRIFLVGDGLENDLFLDNGAVEALESSATSNQITRQILIPSYVERGDYYVKVIADFNDTELESDETNNADSILLQVTNPDLTLTGVIASPNIISVGFPTTIELDVENIGRVNAPATSLLYVLSVDEFIDNSDYFYGTRSVQAIDSLSDVTVSTELTIPSSTDPGDYFMIVVVDPGELIPEIDEENNQITVGITVKVPDLEVLNEGVDKTVVGSSEVLEIEARVTNTSSDAKAPESILAYYLSESSTKNDSSRLADFINVETLELGATSTNKILNYEIPADVEAGNYHIVFSADDPEQVNETDETNNIVSLPVEITNPDLNPFNLVLSKSSLELSETFNVSVEVTNIGDSKSANGSLRYYLSTEETTLNDSSIYLGINFHNELTVGQDTLLENKTVSIPSFLDPTDYFLLVFVDADSLIAETDETNNIVSSPINLLFPDLTTINEELDKTSVSVGDTLTVSYNLKNDGAVNSNTSVTRFFLAGSDTTYLSNFNESEAVLEANGTASSKDIELIIPFTVVPGDYKLGIEVDAFDNNIESDEENNVALLDVTITPIDLIAVSGFTIPARIEPDSTNVGDQSYQIVDFTIEATASIDPDLIRNEIPRALSRPNLYLSEDAVYDASDRLLTLDRQTNTRVLVTADALDFAVFGKVQFPYNTPQGDYFVLFQLDGDSLLNEGDEDNNFTSFAVTYGEAIKPDLVAVDQQVIPAKLTIDKDVAVIHHMINDGVVRVRRYDNAIYLSDDEVLDASDLKLDSLDAFGTNPGLDQQIYYDVELMDLISDGTSYIVGINDEDDFIAEQIEGNNAIATEITFYQPLPIDFTPTCSGHLPEVILAGDLFDFAYEVENRGTGIPEDIGTSQGENFLTIDIFVSDDATLSADDTLVFTDYGRAVSPHEIVAYTRDIRIPGNLTPGTYYVIVQVDALDEYDESDETNNELALEIEVIEPIIPDLTVDIRSISSTVQANTEVSIGLTIANRGGSNLTDISYAFYLSEVNVFSEDLPELEVEERQVSIGAYEDGRNISFFPIIPFDTEPGRYIIFARIDDDKTITESNEDNNIAFASVEVQGAVVPDFRMIRQQSTLIAYQGEVTDNLFQVSYIVRNDGTKEDVLSAGVYLSLDDTFDEQDILLDESFEFFLSGFGSQRFITSTFELPDLLEGEYSIFLVADPDEEVFELDKENNIDVVDLIVFPPSKPDVTPDNGLSVQSSTIGLNGVIEISQFVNNIDRAPLDSVLVRFYISSDPTVSANDLLLTELYSPSIGSFGGTTVFASEIIPSSLTIGDYFLISVLDEDNELDESNEANNEEFIAITLTGEVQPDLTPTINSLSATSINANTVLGMNYRISNIGSGAVLSYEVSFYLSRDDVVDANDIEISTEELGLLNAGSSRTVNTSLLIPSTTDPGNYNLIIVSDPGETVDEEDETNNIDLIAIEILEPAQPDLTSAITSLSASLNARQILELNHRTNNIGDGAATENSVTIYLSDDAILDGNDQVIGSGTTEPLTANTSFTQPIEITIPDVTPGDFFVISVVDEEGSVSEADETNNEFVISRTIEGPIFPDLLVSTLSLDEAAVNAGNNVEITARIQNIGENASTETTVEFYLSTDEVIDASDVSLGSEEVNPIVSMSSLNVTASYVVPSSTTIGDYFILADVNPNETLEEDSFDNNTNSTAIEVLERLLADLEVTSATVQPSEIPAGQEGNLSISIFNFGGGSAGSFVTDVFLSTDQTQSGDDVLLSSVTVDGLTFGESSIVPANFTIDESTTVGSYHLILDIDANNQVEETDEANNSFTVPVEILESLKPDLVPQSLAFDASTINAGGTLGVSFTAVNQGDIATEESQVGVYFSDDATLDASDELITSLTLVSLNPGSSDNFNTSVPIPLNETPGNYFVIVNVDDANSEVELDESNNTASLGIEVTEPLPGNLTISDISANATDVAAGQTVQVTVTISNPSSNAVLPYSAGVYLSDDATFSAQDELLDELSFDVLEGQNTTTASFDAALSNTLAPGDYFLIARVDNNQVVTETDETDNDANVEITVSEALSVVDQSAIIIYPNPATEDLNVELASSGYDQVSIIDLAGRVVFIGRLTSEEHVLDISKLKPGEYILRLQGKGVEELSERFIKQ